LERVKAIRRNASAAADADSYRPELTADDERRYLRRQKPVEIRRKKFSGRGWPFYRRILVLSCAGVAGVTVAVYGMQFLLYSPTMLLLKPDQIELNGNRIVSREAVLQQFVHDRNRSVLRVPLDARRNQLEQISLGRIRQRAAHPAESPSYRADRAHSVAFARNGNELALIDAHGVILDRPRGEDLHFRSSPAFRKICRETSGKAHADV